MKIIVLAVMAMFTLTLPWGGAVSAQSALTKGVKTVRLSVIRVGTQSDADAVLAQLKAGVTFADLARQVSTGPTKNQGGSIGEFAMADLRPEFQDALKGLAIGGTTGIIVTATREFYILRLDGDSEHPQAASVAAGRGSSGAMSALCATQTAEVDKLERWVSYDRSAKTPNLTTNLAKLAAANAFLKKCQDSAPGTFDDALAAVQHGDYARGLTIWRPLAESGDSYAQYNLGVTYDEGNVGVPQDYAEAAKWFRRSADQGFAGAQAKLALLYFDGRGVKQDYAEAAKWFRRGADQGFALAQANLGAMYGQGQGVPRDYVEVYKWYSLAVKRYSDSERNERADASFYRDATASKMTPTQIAEAEKLVREWKPRPER